MPKSIKEIVEHPLSAPIFLFALAFGLRLALVITTLDFPFFQSPIMDMLYHDDWARRIAGGNLWGSEVFFRAPLYPYFLGLLYAISDGSITFARAVQAVIGGVSTVVCFFVGLELFRNRRIAFVGAALLATIWTAVYFDIELLLVVLEVFFDLLAVFFLLKARDGALRNFALAGLFIGLSAITRPNILAFALFVWLIYIFARPRLDKRKLITGLVTFYVIVIAVIIPVTVRNYVVGNDLVLVSSQGGVNLYIGNNPYSDGATAVVPGTRNDWGGGYYDAIFIAETDEGRKLKPSGVDRYYIKKTLDFFVEEPATAAKLLLWKAYIYTNPLEIANNFDSYYIRSKFPLLKYDPISLYIILPFAFLGMGVFVRRFREYSSVYLFTLIYSATVVLFFVNDKFRMPVVPFFCLFAAAAFFWLWEKTRSKEWKPTIAAGVALVALFVFCWIPLPGDPTKHAFIQAACTVSDQYMYLGLYEEAERELAEAVERDPEHPFTLLTLGNLYLETDRKDEAAEAYEEVLSVGPSPCDILALNNLSVYYTEKGEFDKAHEYLNRSLKLHPRNAKTLYFRARVFVAEGRDDEAREALRLGLEYEPDFKPGHVLLGELAEKAGDLDEAEKAYTALLEMNPTDRYGTLGLAQVNHKRGEYAVAERYYKRCLHAYKGSAADFSVVHYNLACCLALQGKEEEALDELEKAIESDPELYGGHAAEDPDFESLRGNERFKRLTAR
jgi:tetratricopeptide (TPR) repeat protein